MRRNNIAIRNAHASDAQLLAKWWNDGKIMAHAGFPDGLGTSPAEVEEGLKADEDRVRRRLILEYDKEAIGEMSYRFKTHDTAEIGIKICVPTLREKGIGTQALTLLIEHLFNELDAKRIILDTNVTNPRAQHVYKKLGFEETYYYFNAWTNQHGELQSSVHYQLLKTK